MKPSRHLKLAHQFARLLDSQFSFLGIRFGIDSIIGLIPGFGDIITTIFSLYLLWIGFQLKLPAEALLQMILNIVIDSFIGSWPVVGDVLDIFFRSNLRNFEILQRYAPDFDFEEGEVIEKKPKM